MAKAFVRNRRKFEVVQPGLTCECGSREFINLGTFEVIRNRGELSCVKCGLFYGRVGIGEWRQQADTEGPIKVFVEGFHDEYNDMIRERALGRW